MSTLKCKMCGGTIDFEQGTTVAQCEYCGTKQTLPRLDDDRKANLYDRANHFRRNNEYDKAMSIYEQILNEDSTDAESYWSIVLCKYGIEYVEDPATHKRVPTVNRAQFTSVIADEDYKKALEYADIEQKIIYEEEAKTIDEIQKGILEISKKEDPFDVFICYKETDNDGRRTRDSVLATDLYHQLVQEGFKVFFSRITLEDKLGTAYEPYIFAALNSAKVMVVLGTKPEFFNAVWVKNEWSRYLALIRKGEKKMLIPAYKDMDPYDLPEEFSHLQAQDMGKLGFMQDLIRGIKKIIEASKPQAQTVTQNVVNNYSANVTALLKRGNMALEDGEWDRANEFFEEVLNNDAECAEAYWGKFLVSRKASSAKAFFDNVSKSTEQTEDTSKEAFSPDDKHIERMAAEYEINGYLPASQIRELYDYDLSYISSLDYRKEQRESVLSDIADDRLYARAKRYSNGTVAEIDDTVNKLAELLDSRVSESEEEDATNCRRIKEEYEAFVQEIDQNVIVLNKECFEKRESDYTKIYETGLKYEAGSNKLSLEKAIESFESIAGWNDASQRSEECRNKLKSLIELEENERKESIYVEALSLANQNNELAYARAIDKFREIAGYRDADKQRAFCRQKIVELKDKEAKRKKRIRNTIIAGIAVAVVSAIVTIIVVKVIIPNSKYNKALELYNAGNYSEAADSFAAMDGYKDSADYVNKSKYAMAKASYDAGEYDKAIQGFTELGSYGDSSQMILQCKYDIAKASYDAGSYEEAITGFTELTDFSDSKDMVMKSKYAIAKNEYDSKDYDKAIESFTELGSYNDADQMVLQCKYDKAVYLHDSGNANEALTIMTELGSYNDADKFVMQCKYDAAVELFNDEQYDDALFRFYELGDYSESKDYANKCYPHLKVGDRMRFGNYVDGKEWTILDKKDNRILILCDNVVIVRQFDSKTNKWEKSEIRSWLNNTFLKEAFSQEEQKQITKYNGDKVFLLSISEFNKYKTRINNIFSFWWLRSPGYDSNYAAYVDDSGNDGTHAAYVDTFGDVVDLGNYVDRDGYGVRPALWINLES